MRGSDLSLNRKKREGADWANLSSMDVGGMGDRARESLSQRLPLSHRARVLILGAYAVSRAEFNALQLFWLTRSTALVSLPVARVPRRR
jgi:hypothetical protein